MRLFDLTGEIKRDNKLSIRIHEDSNSLKHNRDDYTK